MSRVERLRENVAAERARIDALTAKTAESAADLLATIAQPTPPAPSSPRAEGRIDASTRQITQPVPATPTASGRFQGIRVRAADEALVERIEQFAKDQQRAIGTRRRGLSIYARAGWHLLAKTIDDDPQAAIRALRYAARRRS